MGKAHDPGPGSRADNPQDEEVTGDLPMSLTTFVGRERELDELRSLFREGKRLVTLVGIGGIGKTRLALELGFSAGDVGWASVYFVELAWLADPGLVDGAVLESVAADPAVFRCKRRWSTYARQMRCWCWIVASTSWVRPGVSLRCCCAGVHP